MSSIANSTSVILAIDQGTTGTRAFLFDRRGRVVAQSYRELTQHFPKPGWVEHDPEEILRSTWHVIAQALRRARRSASAIAAIGITNQRETTLLWDRRTGRAVSRAIVWQCRRSAPLCDALRRRGMEPFIRRRTGLVLDAYFSGTKLRWLLEHHRGLAARARAGQLAFGTVDTWLLWHLTGGAVHATDPTNASRTLLYNIRSRRWDPELLRRFGIPAALLPVVKPSSGEFGVTAKIGPLPSGIPITGIAGDQQASLVGHGCLRPGEAKNTYGTGCFLLMNTGEKLVPSRHGLLTTLAYGGSAAPCYALEGSVFIAGAAIQWLRDGLRLIRDAAHTDAIARRTPSTGGVYVVPAFVGLGAPYWDMQARGAIVGLTRGSTRDIIVRATLESLAYQTADVVQAMQHDAGRRLSRLEVDGGAAQNDWLMQFQADVLGIDVVRPRMTANTAKGAALLAGIGAGWWHPQRLSGLMGEPDRVFHPRMPPAQRRRLLAGWREAVERVRTSAR
ncbi:MAG: glycerol kinase GlpK [Candidatus Omnitrophica bacterium]|nr:glycerol kinase GlpK [Candidatus Omnitrophota bacterium]